ncbi:hypothetical protein B0H17DRAFT_1106206 [Mycena rosella]|uniref:Fungal-type protein kinase domain-containing protein n=1 Tax=Mycena rosella TaxID=1033263 RepID=A0AAD7C3J7_MYCRO|nr:hypothetical protein B0H17DRAFT_1106206 [Mycena rosella]
MTSTVIRILRFDRTGCCYTQPIYYHQDPMFFVKLVLLSSFNEELLGFDTSISSIVGQRAMKMTPPELFKQTKQCWEPNTTELVFTLANMFSRRTIRSRGTVCWIAEHAGQQYIIKGYWRADGRAHESAFLKELAGVKGVGQMFAFADDRDSIKAGRGFGDEETMMSDGQNTFEQIVPAHFPPQTYDVVIDWDLAKEMEKLIQDQGTDGDLRTRAYQSVKVLNGSSQLSHHDNKDDIESIFYVLYHVLFGHDTSENPLHFEALGQIADWQNIATRPRALATSKWNLLQRRGEQVLTRYTGQENTILFAIGRPNPTEFPKYTQPAAEAEYAEFLSIIDGAILKLPEVLPMPAPPSPTEDESNESASKRTRAQRIRATKAPTPSYLDPDDWPTTTNGLPARRMFDGEGRPCGQGRGVGRGRSRAGR